ncbi:hypothetical protein GIB67_013876, partial [Kingdonia uniflora]
SCTPWNFGPRVNLVRTILDVVRTRCYVFRVGDQLSQSRLNRALSRFTLDVRVLSRDPYYLYFWSSTI